MAGQHVPERTCVGCRLQQPKRLLVRVVRTPGGSVGVDQTGKRAGRGAYLCQRPSCWQVGLRKVTLARALKTTIESGDRDALEAFAAKLPTIDVDEIETRGQAQGSSNT
jgi:predicted RNA-binding protein YlxR (DUF448 family)